MTLGTTLLVLSLTTLLCSVALGLAAALSGALATRAPVAGPSPTSPGRDLAARAAHATMLTACLALLSAMGIRTVMAGHAPWSNLHEVTVAVAAMLLGSYLVARRRAPIGRLAPPVALLGAVLVLMALQLPDELVPLAPALQAPLLLTVHVGAAIGAYALGGLAFVAALGVIVQARAGDRVVLLPPGAVCAAVAHRCVLVAFPILTAAIALGSAWANLAWRSYWNNDPKELAAAGTWLLYAAYLHVAGRGDRAGRAAPWLLVAGFAGILFTFLGASLLFPGQHSYAGV
jgi:ABC-type transport system involved in cytochrome c biogenesis permease subunit